jgi:hypothetical protein
MIDLCFSKKPLPGLEGAFWRFEGIDAADDVQLKKEIARRLKGSDVSLGAIAKAIFEELTRFSGCARYCVKFPVDVMHTSLLLEWFPGCRIVHITRDPRALAMSKTNDPSGTATKVIEHPLFAWFIRKASIWFTVFQYRAAARLHMRFKDLENYRLFRYEDLLANPEETLRELCVFIGTDFAEDMLTPQKGRHEHQPSSLTGRRQKAFDSEAAIRWRTLISPVDYLTITCLTNGSMRKLGYNPKTHPIFRQGGSKHLSGATQQVIP